MARRGGLPVDKLRAMVSFDSSIFEGWMFTDGKFFQGNERFLRILRRSCHFVCLLRSKRDRSDSDQLSIVVGNNDEKN
jgi:hypothetical protein